MYRIGFIGYGSMGSMLLKGFIASGEINPGDIIVSTRTISKLDEIKSMWNDIKIVSDNRNVAKSARYIFLCVKPAQVKDVLDEIKDYITSDTHIISIAGPVKIKNIENITIGKVSKLTPSLTTEVCEGISLICHGTKVAREDAEFIEGLLRHISSVKVIKECDFELAAEITSCGPGLLAALFKEFVSSAMRYTLSISKEDIEEMVRETLSGTVKLLSEKNMTFEEVMARVATKGGITEEGIKVLNAGLPQTFDDMFNQMLAKRKAVDEQVNKAYD